MHPPPSPRTTSPVTVPERRPLLTPARTVVLLAAVSGALVALVVAQWGPLFSFDHASARKLHGWALADPGATRANRLLSDWVWDPWTMRSLTAVAVVLVWLRGERLLAVWVAATSAAGTAVQQVLKAAVGRDRPHWRDPVDSAHFAAFPSGHAMTATVTCLLLLWLLRLHGAGRRLWGTAVAVASVSVLGVGFTRLWLGVHWGSDVLGGWLLGGCLVALSAATYGRLALSRDR
jgi:membrane-associated phospholipid phosphatase